MLARDLGLLPYRGAWAIQEQTHAAVLAGGPETLLLVEHSPVITFGRRPGISRNLIASPDQLAQLGVEVVQSDRGGDITFHGPGQIVAYPIIRLLDHQLSVGAYVRRLQEAVIATLAELDLAAQTDPQAIGIWVPIAGQLHKICALGVRIRRGVSMHGIALNVNTDLSYFNLIVPCGLTGRPVTSIQQVLNGSAPSMEKVKAALTRKFHEFFS